MKSDKNKPIAYVTKKFGYLYCVRCANRHDVFRYSDPVYSDSKPHCDERCDTCNCLVGE